MGSDFDFMTILTTEESLFYKSQSWRADPDCLPPGCSIASSCAATNGERLFSVAPITKRISNGLAATEGSSVTLGHGVGHNNLYNLNLIG